MHHMKYKTILMVVRSSIYKFNIYQTHIEAYGFGDGVEEFREPNHRTIELCEFMYNVSDDKIIKYRYNKYSSLAALGFLLNTAKEIDFDDALKIAEAAWHE